MLFAAASRQDLFESITVGSGASMDLGGDILREIIASPFGQIDGARDGEHVVENIKLLAKTVPPYDILEGYRLASAGGWYEAASAYARAYPEDLPRLHALLPKITTPTLVISGRTDPIVPPENGAFLVERLPHARGEVVEAGHFVWEDAAEAYAGLIARWVNGGFLEA